MKKWITQPLPPKEFTSAHPELPAIATRLLWNRNLRTPEQIDEFLNPDYTSDIHDPFLFRDMEKAVTIIFDAIKNKQNITVHGDYDADGVCASVILIQTLLKLGAKPFTEKENTEGTRVFLPHREIDGYGLNTNTVKHLHKKHKTNLIITCDCGVSNLEEIKLTKELGMKIIITDHHAVPAEIPLADAIIHPKLPNEPYPDKGLCGAGVAFKLAQALLKKYCSQTNGKLSSEESCEGFEKWLLDLVAIATIGDMVPLIGESRTLTRYGLTVLNKTKNLGLKELYAVAGIVDENGKFKHACDPHTVGFQIVPRLNAAGRMEHATVAFELLMAPDQKSAQKLAEQLNKNNSDRQKLTEQIVKSAHEQIESTNQKSNPILFVFDEKWTTGILGLVAGKLKDEFYKPVFVLGKNAEGNIVGSSRGISEFNIIVALQSMPEYFIKFGGHPQAAGLSIKDNATLENFKAAIIARAQKELSGVELVPQIEIDAEVDLENVNWKLYNLLQKFEPFGMNNPEPTYGACGLTLVSADPVGQDGKHLRLMVKHNSHTVHKTIAFGFGDTNRHPADWKKTLKPGDKIDLAFTIDVNEWNGNRELELKIEDIKKAQN
ncbi:MAG: single-stranded-DNA-specific exonuclease RecJ [Candidatus Magasanikbacteria bacterium]